MSADYRQLTEFSEQINRLNNEQKEQFLEACCKELAARLLAKVIRRTPVGRKPRLEGPRTVRVQGESGRSRTVLSAEAARIQQYWGDYHGGTLRRGWTGGQNVKAVDYANSLEITKTGGKYSIAITNPVEYASYVEYGHRQNVGRYVPALGKSLKQGWVQGKFMLSISEGELNNVSDAILRKKLKKFMKEVFGE